jgi:hypothetical protein
MKPNGWDAWRPQEPPSDFAARAAAAVVRDRRERQRSARRRSIGVGMLAAAMIGGSAFGLAALVGAKRTVTPDVRPPIRYPAPVATRMPVATALPAASAQAEPVPAASAAPLRIKKREAAPAAGALVDAGRPLIVPRCSCGPEQVVCDCLE